MCDPPARIECTSVNTLRPGLAPPTRPSRRTVSSINDSSSSRPASVAGRISPALATRLSSSKMTSTRSNGCDTRVTESASRDCGTDDVRHRHRPSSGGLSRGYAHHLTPSRSVDRGLAGAALACGDLQSADSARRRARDCRQQAMAPTSRTSPSSPTARRRQLGHRSLSTDMRCRLPRVVSRSRAPPSGRSRTSIPDSR